MKDFECKTLYGREFNAKAESTRSYVFVGLCGIGGRLAIADARRLARWLLKATEPKKAVRK